MQHLYRENGGAEGSSQILILQGGHWNKVQRAWWLSEVRIEYFSINLSMNRLEAEAEAEQEYVVTFICLLTTAIMNVEMSWSIFLTSSLAAVC